ncbi:hypothetical protein CEP53_006862 [Fusarium sp. AF-6]|nr:hypothetical protein CEP53_006862 [Fusarium sp. AF-6]
MVATYTTFHRIRRHWESFLPSKATLMLARYLDSTGTINAFISTSILSTNCGWMLMIPGQDPDMDTTASGDEDDALVARELAVDASKQVKSLNENFQHLVGEVVTQVERIQAAIDNLQCSHTNQDTFIANSFREVRQTGEHHAALIEALQQQLTSLQMTPWVTHEPAQTNTSGGMSSSFGNPSTPSKPPSRLFAKRHTPTRPSGAAARATTGAKGGVTKDKSNYGKVFGRNRGN